MAARARDRRSSHGIDGQYWKPVWEALERYWKPVREKREGARRRSGTLHLAQELSNRGRRIGLSYPSRFDRFSRWWIQVEFGHWQPERRSCPERHPHNRRIRRLGFREKQVK